jgi:hypothetical protein
VSPHTGAEQWRGDGRSQPDAIRALHRALPHRLERTPENERLLCMSPHRGAKEVVEGDL